MTVKRVRVCEKILLRQRIGHDTVRNGVDRQLAVIRYRGIEVDFTASSRCDGIERLRRLSIDRVAVTWLGSLPKRSGPGPGPGAGLPMCTGQPLWPGESCPPTAESPFWRLYGSNDRAEPRPCYRIVHARAARCNGGWGLAIGGQLGSANAPMPNDGSQFFHRHRY